MDTTMIRIAAAVLAVVVVAIIMFRRKGKAAE